MIRAELPHGELVGVSRHAVERWVERVRPGAELADAYGQLCRAAAAGTWVPREHGPSWLRRADVLEALELHPPTLGYVMLGEAIALIVARQHGWSRAAIVTVLVRGVLPEQARRARNEANARRRRAKHPPKSSTGPVFRSSRQRRSRRRGA